MKKLGLYEWSVFLFFVVLPILTLVVEYCLFGAIIDIDLILKWITFYYVGCRLFSAGVKQLISPEFTLNEIFHIKEKGAAKLVREIGFANVSFGLTGIAALFSNSFINGAALSGGLYYGFAGLAHIKSVKTNKEEVFSMVTDLLAFIVIEVCLIKG